ncbi:MAG TPA: ergothioneine biosynthesis protein EgtB [Pseudomonadales bacterium]
MSLARHAERDALGDRFAEIREVSRRLCEPLALEDYVVQPVPEASPPKWHLAHTTWFFETFLLKPLLPRYTVFHPGYEYLFNSYYNGVGQQFPRAERGRLSRPTVAEILDYRAHVDEAMARLLDRDVPEIVSRTVLGLHHEQQHQELLITDLKANLGTNPLAPAYVTATRSSAPADAAARELGFVSFAGGLVEIGAAADVEFCFDNERPRHSVHLVPFALADRLVTCEDYLAFMADGGYETPSLWLSDGWRWVQSNGGQAPLYWSRGDGGWQEYRLTGQVPVVGAAPVTHICAYEADAFARWAGYRLPTEAEWEAAAERTPPRGHFADSGLFHPQPAGEEARVEVEGLLSQLFGDTWEWTSSSYGAYPGYQPLAGTLGEYNGKFMANQLVLRGGSCATPADHVRASYRNFFYPSDRWQFTGIRLAKDA